MEHIALLLLHHVPDVIADFRSAGTQAGRRPHLGWLVGRRRHKDKNEQKIFWA
jgi:hypothetical protein